MRALASAVLLFGQACIAALIRTEFPHLIIPLVSKAPEKAFGTRKDASVSYERATGSAEYVEVSFDVPNNKAAICRIQFYINTNRSKNAPRDLQGDAPFQFNISRLDPHIDEKYDTWNSFPDVLEHVKTVEVTPSGVRWQSDNWFPCPKGEVAQFLLRPAGNRDFYLYWYELDYAMKDGGPHGVVLEMHT